MNDKLGDEWKRKTTGRFGLSYVLALELIEDYPKCEPRAVESMWDKVGRRIVETIRDGREYCVQWHFEEGEMTTSALLFSEKQLRITGILVLANLEDAEVGETVRLEAIQRPPGQQQFEALDGKRFTRQAGGWERIR